MSPYSLIPRRDPGPVLASTVEGAILRYLGKCVSSRKDSYHLVVLVRIDIIFF